MKRSILLIFIGVMISCSTVKNTSSNPEKYELLITRKYIGNFLEYSHTGPQIVGGHDLIWIKTTVYDTFGNISAYSKNCEFAIGDRIYLKRTGSTPGVYGNWEYLIENDYSVSYKVSEYRYENNVFVRTRSL